MIHFKRDNASQTCSYQMIKCTEAEGQLPAPDAN